MDKMFIELLGAESKSAAMHEDYSCTLNQTNVTSNKNKFYVIQLAQGGGKSHVFLKWGRVVRSCVIWFIDQVFFYYLQHNIFFDFMSAGIYSFFVTVFWINLNVDFLCHFNKS